MARSSHLNVMFSRAEKVKFLKSRGGRKMLRVYSALQALILKYVDYCDDAGVRNTPSSYRQLDGRGQLLSRRYCKHSVWLLWCASHTAR